MQDRVLDPTGVLLHRQPLAADLLVHERVVDLGIDVAEHVPGRIHERVHRVGVAARRFATLRARRVHERLDPRERRAATPGELDVAWELNGQLVVWHRDGAVGVAVHDRDRRSPITLARDQPVAQAIRDRWTADAALLRLFGDGVLSFFAARSRVRPTVDHDALARVSVVHGYDVSETFLQVVRAENRAVRRFVSNGAVSDLALGRAIARDDLAELEAVL